MNTQEMVKMCKNIYTDYTGMGREKANEDKHILATIMTCTKEYKKIYTQK